MKTTQAACLTLCVLVGTAAAGCGSSTSTPIAQAQQPEPGLTTSELPSDIPFKKIGQEFEQQQDHGQQFGPFCPPKFKMEVDRGGKVEVQDSRGNPYVKGKMTTPEFVEFASLTNDAPETQVRQEMQKVAQRTCKGQLPPMRERDDEERQHDRRQHDNRQNDDRQHDDRNRQHDDRRDHGGWNDEDVPRRPYP